MRAYLLHPLVRRRPGFFQLLCSGIWKIDTPEELREAFEACSQLAPGQKVAKVFVEEDRTHVSASLELFVADRTAVRQVFTRSIGVLEITARELRDRMRQGREERNAS